MLSQSLRPWCRGQADDRDIGEAKITNHLRIKSIPAMNLINDDLVSIGHLATLQGLHGGNLNGSGVVGQDVVGLDDANIRHALCIELFDRLIDQAQCRDDEDCSLAGVLNAPQSMRGDNSFAESGRRLHHNAIAAVRDCYVELVEQAYLMGSEVCAHATS